MALTLGDSRDRAPGRLRRVLKKLGPPLVGLAVLFLPLEIGLRLIYRTNDSRVLVYPRKANEYNGFGGPDFGRHIPEGEYRILALGASAFVTRSFPPEFQRLLNESLFFAERGLRARVVSTGVPAHMSHDSLWKYRYWYRGYDFDLVIYYHGINDARANAYPRQEFREDYTQLPYYRQFVPAFEWIERHPLLSRSFVATLIARSGYRLAVIFAPDFQREAPYNHPDNDGWLGEALEVKTAPVFERNLEELLALARERGQRVLLLTYAHYLPEDYSNERFLAQETDYTFMPESVATEVWGWKDAVVAAIEEHNEAVRRVAARHPEALFFDMARHIPKGKAWFIDICHWTDEGRASFTEGVLQALQAAGK